MGEGFREEGLCDLDFGFQGVGFQRSQEHLGNCKVWLLRVGVLALGLESLSFGLGFIKLGGLGL